MLPIFCTQESAAKARSCGSYLHRDTNAAVNILNLGKQARVGQTQSNATGVETNTLLGVSLEEPSSDDKCRISASLDAEIVKKLNHINHKNHSLRYYLEFAEEVANFNGKDST